LKVSKRKKICVNL